MAIGTLGCAVALLTMLAVTRRDPGRGRRRRKATAQATPNPESADEWLGPLRGLGVRPNTRRNPAARQEPELAQPGPDQADPGWLPDQDQGEYPRYREWGKPAGDHWAPAPDDWNRSADQDGGYAWGPAEPAAAPGLPDWPDADPQAPGGEWAPGPAGDLEADYSGGGLPRYRPVPPSLMNQPAVGYAFDPGSYPAQAPEPDGPWPGDPYVTGLPAEMPAQPDVQWPGGPYAAEPHIAPAAGSDSSWADGPYADGPRVALPAGPDGQWASDPHVVAPEPPGPMAADPYAAGPYLAMAVQPDGSWLGDPYLTGPQAAVPVEPDGPGAGRPQVTGAPVAQAPDPGGIGDEDDTTPMPVIIGTEPPEPDIYRNEPVSPDGPVSLWEPAPAQGPASIWLPPTGPEPAAEWAETPPGPEPVVEREPFQAGPLGLGAVPESSTLAADAHPPAPGDAVPGSAQEKMEQIKELYLTAEAIGEDALTKHFELLSQRQRDLIREFFEEAGLGAGGAPEKPGADSAPDSAPLLG